MTPEQELEKKRKRLRLLQLEEEEASAHAVDPANMAPVLEHSLSPQQALAASVERQKDIGGTEHYINKTVDTLPLGRPITNVASTLGVQLMKALGVGDSNVRFTDKAKEEMRAKGMPVPTEESALPGKGFLDTYRKVRDARNETVAEGDRQHPFVKWLGTGTGLGLGMLAPGLNSLNAGPGLGGATLTGAGYGSLFGATHGGADLTKGEFGQFANDIVGLDGLKAAYDDAKAGHYLNAAGDVMGAGALGGAATGLGLGLAGKGVKGGVNYAAEKTGGYVTPTPEAQRLMDEGANLTVGYMDPGSQFGRLEELAAEHGGGLAKSRQAAARSARDILIKKAGAPGAQAPTAGARVADQIAELESGYGNAYDTALKGERLSPEIYQSKGKFFRGITTDPNYIVNGRRVPGAFELATKNPNILATDAEREFVSNWLQQQATAIPKVAQAGGEADAVAFQQLRRRLRAQAAKWEKSGTATDQARAEMVRNASDHITEMMDTQLPPEKASLLRATDAKYRDLLAMQDAAERANVQDHAFTPAQALQAQQKVGATPELNALTRDAQAIFGPNYPRTGVQNTVLEHAGSVAEHIPFVKKFGPMWTGLVNSSPYLQAHALGTQAPLGPGMSSTRFGQAFTSLAGEEAVPELARQQAIAKALRDREEAGGATLASGGGDFNL